MDSFFSIAFMQIDNTRLWGGWLSRQTTSFDVIALAIIIIVITFGYARKYSKVKEEDIPLEFWYKVPQSRDGQNSLREKKQEARNIASVFIEQKLDAVIFWGSQSGRAENLARRLAKRLQDRFGLNALAADLDDYDHDNLRRLMKSCLCGFVVSTYGDGDPPDNTNGFWHTLHNFQTNGSRLENLRYIIFGLGNSNYRQYNRVAEVVDTKLQTLGARRYGQMGDGDDASGETENGFLSWRRGVEEVLKNDLGLSERDRVYKPAFDVKEDPLIPPNSLHLGEPAVSSRPRLLQGQLADSKPARAITVSQIRALWESDDRLCLHIELDLGMNRLVKYKTGDHMAIWPCNPDHEVERTISALGLGDKRQSSISIQANEKVNIGQVPVPSPTTIEALFRYYLEICGSLSLETVAALKQFAPSDVARQALHLLTDDSEAFKSQVIAVHMTLADLLETVAPKAVWSIPISFLLERLKPLQPRYYSISSSTAVHPRAMSLTAVITKPERCGSDLNILPKGCYGLATSYLHALAHSLNKLEAVADALPIPMPTYLLSGPRQALDGGKIFGRVRQSAFKLPTKASTPIIMIGAGAGVAPFRAFMQERARRHEISQDVGQTLLFMGFRDYRVDLIYQDEWTQWRQDLGPDVFEFWTAFSRQDPDRKVYVQDILIEQAKQVMDILENSYSSRIYICGSAQMARDVKTVLISLKSQSTDVSDEEALVWVQHLRQSNRLMEDVWS